MFQSWHGSSARHQSRQSSLLLSTGFPERGAGTFNYRSSDHYCIWNWALDSNMVYPNSKFWIWFPFLRYSKHWERDPNVNNAWYCGGILRLCNITSNKRFWSGGNDIDSLCAHQIWNMKHWALAKSTNVGREEPGSHLSGSSSSLYPLLENEMEEINYLNI